MSNNTTKNKVKQKYLTLVFKYYVKEDDSKVRQSTNINDFMEHIIDGVKTYSQQNTFTSDTLFELNGMYIDDCDEIPSEEQNEMNEKLKEKINS